MAKASFPAALKHGRALPLSDGDVTVIAGYLGCHIAAVRAVLAVESAGKGFGPDGRPIILNEPHIFYRELGAGAKRDKAVANGLAYAKWKTKPYLKTQAERYDWMDKAIAIDEAAALKSCSWGLGQLMGFNYKICGFKTVQEFVEAMLYSEGAQLYGMARFIVSSKLQAHMRSLNWASFAKGYNGAGYKQNKYDAKLAAAYANRPASEKVTPPPASASQLAVLLGQGAAQPDIEPTAPVTAVPEPVAVSPLAAFINALLALFKKA